LSEAQLGRTTGFFAARLERVVDHRQHPVMVREYLGEVEPAEAVQRLHALVEAAVRGKYRPAWLAFALAAATNGLPRRLVARMHRAATEAEDELMSLLLVAGDAAHVGAHDSEFGPDEILEQLTLGERKAKARSQDRAILERLIFDGDPAVVSILLDNPRTIEPDVVRLAGRRPNRTAVLREIGKNPKWLARAQVRRALAGNPYCPVKIAVAAAPLLGPPELEELRRDRRLHLVVRQAAQLLIDLRRGLGS
jgi:hypothetical protein